MMRLTNIISISCLIALIGLLSGCDISDNDEVILGESFTKIYDNNQFNASFIPIDIVQTSDKGYLILGATRSDVLNFPGLYIMKVDEDGLFVSEQNLSEEYFNPVKSLMQIGQNYYFLAMNASLQSVLFELDNDGAQTKEPILVGLNGFPQVASLDEVNTSGQDFIITQSYDIGNGVTSLSTIDINGGISNSRSFTIGAGEDFEDEINDHFLRTGKQFPFAVGRTANGVYYFNGFYEFTLSLTFTNLDSDDPRGVSQGLRNKAGISAITPISGNQFAISRFSFGDNYIIPNANIDANAISSSVDIDGNSFPELVPDAPVVLKKLQVDGKEVLLYASDTKSGQIILLAYSIDGTLLGTKYLGFSNRFNISSFISTEDEGLAVLASTSVAGRFERFGLFKLSKEELNELVN